MGMEMGKERSQGKHRFYTPPRLKSSFRVPSEEGSVIRCGAGEKVLQWKENGYVNCKSKCALHLAAPALSIEEIEWTEGKSYEFEYL
jgi:hypothetical protein